MGDSNFIFLEHEGMADLEACVGLMMLSRERHKFLIRGHKYNGGWDHGGITVGISMLTQRDNGVSMNLWVTYHRNIINKETHAASTKCNNTRSAGVMRSTNF